MYTLSDPEEALAHVSLLVCDRIMNESDTYMTILSLMNAQDLQHMYGAVPFTDCSYVAHWALAL